MKYVHHKSNLGYVLLFGLTLTFGPSQAEFAQWFGPEQPIALPTASQVQVAIGDLDSDSVSDVVCVDNNGLKWLRGLGGGSFAPYKGLPTTGSQVRELELVDLDSDGALDIFLLFRHGHEIGWLRGNGQGGFDPHALISNAYDGPYDADFADLDGDSDLDIVVAYLEGDEVRWIENAGSGVFGYPAAIAGIGGAKAVTTLDVDGDGDFDVVAAGGDTRLFTNDGMGGFSAPVIIDNQAGSPYCLETADIDGDGKPDVVAGSRSDYVAWFRNNGVSLDPRAVISSSPDDVSEVVVGDFNGDGWLDVASCSRQDDSVYWYKNLGGAAAWSEELVSSIADEAIDLAHGDLDEDGVPDLAVACWSGKKVAWHENLHTFDCNGNGIPDDQDIAAGTSEDCNGNLSPDECDLASGASTDLDADGQLDDCVTPPLYADTFELSVASGGTQHFTLTAPVTSGLYLLLGSTSGTTPGIPSGGYVVPLNLDGYLLSTAVTPNTPPLAGSFGALTPGAGQGLATASFTLPSSFDPALVGLTLHHAYVTIGLLSGQLTSVSNAVPLVLVP